ncbi:MAG: vanadium-dependent haloperoxidase [Steroidobacteraceae bacterium]|nr:vanadium-dependent haloperoxidase [Steroidobacteraceae bacterium]
MVSAGRARGYLAAVTSALLMTSAAAQADVIAEWTATADAIARNKQLTSPVHGRALALLHVAMFEAVNSIDRRYAPYRLDLVADRNTSHEAAAASAAHAVLSVFYADQKVTLDSALATELDSIAEGPAKQRGIILGRKAAADLMALRHADFDAAIDTYRPFTTPGVYVPTALAVGHDVGRFTPWVMTSAAQFRPAPPPALTSETWTRDVNEIREIGGHESMTRSAEQTSTARFWFLTGARTYNPIVQQVASAKRMDLLDCARLHALASMAGMDAYIAVFDAKYTYNFWRPVTAIRNADLSGNAGTPRDASWLPLGETPLHPEYPCAHCITSAAIAAVLSGAVGDGSGEITLTSPTAPGVTRRWTRLSDYSNEVSNARIWAGFHYRFSTEVGKEMGRKIGELTVSTQLRARR